MIYTPKFVFLDCLSTHYGVIFIAPHIDKVLSSQHRQKIRKWSPSTQEVRSTSAKLSESPLTLAQDPDDGMDIPTTMTKTTRRTVPDPQPSVVQEDAMAGSLAMADFPCRTVLARTTSMAIGY